MSTNDPLLGASRFLLPAELVASRPWPTPPKNVLWICSLWKRGVSIGGTGCGSFGSCCVLPLTLGCPIRPFCNRELLSDGSDSAGLWKGAPLSSMKSPFSFSVATDTEGRAPADCGTKSFNEGLGTCAVVKDTSGPSPVPISTTAFVGCDGDGVGEGSLDGNKSCDVTGGGVGPSQRVVLSIALGRSAKLFAAIDCTAASLCLFSLTRFA
mmetsp:Transcript_27391/g.45803  ORF Transcript_27391/g.45803 Transcript_27391/m.45803 type:complete len:210 (+) Transcript_27391:2507-3136(+)